MLQALSWYVCRHGSASVPFGLRTPALGQPGNGASSWLPQGPCFAAEVVGFVLTSGRPGELGWQGSFQHWCSSGRKSRFFLQKDIFEKYINQGFLNASVKNVFGFCHFGILH